MGFSNYHFSKNPLKTVGKETDPPGKRKIKGEIEVPLEKGDIGFDDPDLGVKKYKVASEEKKPGMGDAAWKEFIKNNPNWTPSSKSRGEEVRYEMPMPELKPREAQIITSSISKLRTIDTPTSNSNGKKKSNGIKKKISSWLIEKKYKSKSRKKLKCAKSGGRFSTTSKTSCSF